MPARKRSSRAQNARTTRTKSPEEISYETKLTIVILLLLFVYPLGLVFMWVWMRNWPVWLKIVISLPLVLGVLALFTGMFFIALLIRNATTSRNFPNRMWEYRRQYMWNQNAPTQQNMMTPQPTDITPTYAY